MDGLKGISGLNGIGEAPALTARPDKLAMPVRALLWLGGFLLALAICFPLSASAGVHNDFSQNVWLPARLLFSGVDPYNPTRQQVGAALGQYSLDFAAFNSGRNFHFIYPLWLAVALSPFAALPLVTANAIWRALNLVLLFWAIGALLRSWNPAFRLLRAPVIGAIAVAAVLGSGILDAVRIMPGYRESFLTLYLGQFSIIELGLLAGVWSWLISSAQREPRARLWGDALTGVALAVLATKPQAVGLPVILLGLWTISRRRFVIPGAALASLAALLVVPNVFYSWSLGSWLGVAFGNGQAGSQASVSASVWGLSYQWLGPSAPWVAVAVILSLVGLVALLPRWWGDLRDRTSPVPLALPLTLCMNSVISPYMLGYEHVLLLMPALLYLAMAGVPGAQADAGQARSTLKWNFGIYTWMAILPLLVVGMQATIDKEYPAIVQSLPMLALCWLVRLNLLTGSGLHAGSGQFTRSGFTELGPTELGWKKQ